ncbi:MAG TPA: alanine--tRNA ligase [Terriglobales bacterium]
MLTGSEIRRRFLEFFQARGHKIVPSSSLVPQGDPTLLFTNAGMNQFKNIFLGLERRDYARAATVQKCVRAGGKHNDLENVGFTQRHHTFFEMLGNFSFGDYFKDEAIALAWELLTSPAGFGMDAGRLYVTVYTEDDEAEAIWRNAIGLGADRVFRLGAAENFWAMGDTGPCGPCSELHYDQGPTASELGHADCRFPCECGRYVEIWNLVFMQYERDGAGTLTPLPRPSIDTGAGLERLTAVLQGKRSNYDTDLFQPIIAAAARRAGRQYGSDGRDDVSLRILADHARAATFLVHDGVAPGNEGRGYVLRKIVRRALRHGRALGIEAAFLHELTGVVADEMTDAYPELEESRARVAAVVRGEEERFAQTLALALREMERLPLQLPGGGQTPVSAMSTRTGAAAGTALPQLAGSDVFRLYDTYGLPLDLLREIASERGFALDEAGFEREMEEQRRRARRSWKGGEQTSAAGVYLELAAAGRTRFEGYEATKDCDCQIRALIQEGQLVESAAAGAELEAVLDHTPFYAASGGQVGDRGVWTTASGFAAEVLDTYAPVSGLTVHRIRARLPLRVGERVEAEVDVARRDATRRNHTATHLLHAALRRVLGTHVKQAGSVVDPDRLRFDFTHFSPLTAEQTEEIERLVNTEILRNEAVTTEILPLEAALESGAMALFGEKYREQVRVVSVAGFSKELCGGTHARRTGDLGLFKVAYESSVAAGVRRIEAWTGEGAYVQFRAATAQLHRLAALLDAQPSELSGSLERLLAHQHQTEEENQRLKMQAARSSAGAAERRRDIDGVSVLTTRVDGLDRAQMRALVDQMRTRHPHGVIALGSEDGAGKATLIVAVSAELSRRVPAGAVIKAIPGATGGGRPEMAEGGAKEAGQIDALLEAVGGAVAQALVDSAKKEAVKKAI